MRRSCTRWPTSRPGLTWACTSRRSCAVRSRCRASASAAATSRRPPPPPPCSARSPTGPRAGGHTPPPHWDEVVRITRPLYRDMKLTHYNHNFFVANDRNLFHWALVREEVAADVTIARAAREGE